MSPRARRLALALGVLALILSLGRWGSLFLADRLWEASVSEAAAAAGSRRALLSLGLELSLILLATAWFAVNFTLAARAALPDRPPPEREHARLWPDRLPRWSLMVLAVVLGVLLGSGASDWLDQLLLTVDGVRLGVPDPLLGADLGVFLRDFPLWLHLQGRAALLITAAMMGVVLLYIAGGALRISERRLWVASRARGHLALLLAMLGLALAWGSVLEPFRLAAGLRGPLLSSEFLLRTLVAEVEAGLGALAAVGSFFWWLRVRGSVVTATWLLYGLAVFAGRVLPLHTEAAASDEDWKSSARALDSIAFGLELPESLKPGPWPASPLVPSLWDAAMLQGTQGDSAVLTSTEQGWIPGEREARPVWFAVRQTRDLPPALLALGDDAVSPAGGPLSWHEGENDPTPGTRAYRELSSETLRPGAPPVMAGPGARGVTLSGWPKRVMLAWALQAPIALRAPAGARLAWRLDPGVRLRAVAPFAHWSEPRPQVTAGQLVWTSDGLLTAPYFPSSTRLQGAGGQFSMMRPAFFGLVEPTTGKVRIFRRSDRDSLSAAWARITQPLIEPRAAVPAGLIGSDPYPADLLAAQRSVLQGTAWHAGLQEHNPEGIVPPAPGAGGTEVVVPFVDQQRPLVRSFLRVRRTPTGDSLRLIRFDSLRMESPAALRHRWEGFPFRAQLYDSVHAMGSTLEAGGVRYAFTVDGIAAYQPAWAVTAGGKAQLVMVNVALVTESAPQRVGVGRTLAEAWRNLRAEVSPTSVGAGPEAVLEQARKWMKHADSALKRGDLQELGRALDYLRVLLEPPG